MERHRTDNISLEEHEARQLRYALIRAIKNENPLAKKIMPTLECIEKEHAVSILVHISLEKFLKDFIPKIFEHYGEFSAEYGLPPIKEANPKVEFSMKQIKRIGFAG